MWTNREYEFMPSLYLLESMEEKLANIRRAIGFDRSPFSGSGMGRKHKRRSRNRHAVMAARRANVVRIRGSRS